LPVPIQTVAYHRDPLGVLRRARARYGPVFTLRVADPIVFVADPAAVATIPELGHAGSARRTVLPLASPRSLFGADEAEHRAFREAIEPRFRDIDEDVIVAVARRHIARWPRGRPFRLLTAMRALADEVFARVVLRLDRPDEYVGAVRRMLRTPGNPPVPVPGDALTARVFRWRARPLVELLERAGLDSDRWLVVVAAAQEPPSIALANALYERARHPDLPFDDAFVAEVLRLRPSASAVLRELTSELSVGGYVLPAGTTVALPSPLLHRDPSAFPSPDAFLVGRRFDGAPYFPFGGGLRLSQRHTSRR
jgi:cytochrome P450